jgi:hypothetical protein
VFFVFAHSHFETMKATQATLVAGLLVASVNGFVQPHSSTNAIANRGNRQPLSIAQVNAQHVSSTAPLSMSSAVSDGQGSNAKKNLIGSYMRALEVQPLKTKMVTR